MRKKLLMGLSILMTAVLLVCSAPVTSPVQVGAYEDKDSLEQKKKEAEKNQKEAKELIEMLKRDKTKLEDAVRKLDVEIGSVQDDIDALNQEIKDLKKEIKQKQKELKKAKKNEKKQYNDMQKRVQFLYENGQMDYIAAMLSATNMSSILNRSEYVTQISKYDYNMLMELIATRKKIAEAEAVLQQDKDAAEELKEINESKMKDLESLEAAKKTKLSKTKQNIQEQEELYEKYEKEVAKYDAALEELERQYNEAGGGGNYDGGALHWPCPASHRISSGFGPRNTGIKGASRYHKGIDIPCPSGSKVVAAEEGTVIAVSYNSARGNYCMVSHGGGLTTLYQHCSKITCSVGQKVDRGEQVAKSGNTGISSGPHLHFETRMNGTPVNPKQFFQ